MAQSAPPSNHPFWKVWEYGTSFHVWLYRTSGGRLGNTMPGHGTPIILLHHVGAKSGTHRVSPVNTLKDGERWIIVASKGGTDKHPAWLHNLKANPETEIEVPERVPVTARVVDEAERAELWPSLVEIYPPYADYQEFAGDRVIQVVALEPRQADRL
jgi:deazaflavin-dependent oxidoreductase (nitroreductase family)